MLSLALLSRDVNILKALIEETNIDLLGVEANGDTCIHIACRNSIDLIMIETILLRLRILIPERQNLQKFLRIKNNDQLTAMDYCVFKHR